MIHLTPLEGEKVLFYRKNDTNVTKIDSETYFTHYRNITL